MNRRPLITVLTAIAITLTACSPQSPGDSADDAAGQTTSPDNADSNGTAANGSVIERTAAPLESGLQITDPHGQELRLDAPPERIVCLSGLCDDIVVDLGLEPAGTSTPDLLTHPALLGDQGSEVPVVQGSFGSEDVESIAALEPDLVIGLTGVHDPLAATIEEFAPLWLTEPATWEESLGYLRNLGALTGRVDEAITAEERFRALLADAVEQANAGAHTDQSVLLMYGSVDSIGVDTSDSLKGDLLGHLFDYPFPAQSSDIDTASIYSVEELLARQPDVIFVYSLLFAADDLPLSEQLADHPVWAEIPAVQAGEVHEVHPRLWGSGRGARSLAAIVEEALATVAQA